jgi:cystathionine beta-synthase
VKKAYAITDKESFLAGRELLKKEGILGGSSTGTLLAAALKYCKEQTTPKRVLLFVCDTGNKYLSKMYNDYWMLDNGFLEREPTGDLRDLILRPYSQRDTVVVGPAEPLITAYQRMKLYDVSQLPVMDGDKIVGIIDESDALIHVYGDESKFRDPVSTAMVSRLQVLDVGSAMESLLPIFDAGHVAIVMDGEKFLGLITRIDLLNYLRRRVQ